MLAGGGGGRDGGLDGGEDQALGVVAQEELVMIGWQDLHGDACLQELVLAMVDGVLYGIEQGSDATCAEDGELGLISKLFEDSAIGKTDNKGS